MFEDLRAGYGFVPAIHRSGAMNHHSAACCVSGSPGGAGVNLRTIIAVYVRIVARIRSPTLPYAPVKALNTVAAEQRFLAVPRRCSGNYLQLCNGPFTRKHN